jgi:SnoaL-like protein
MRMLYGNRLQPCWLTPAWVGYGRAETPMEHPNVELYRRVTAAFQSGDIDTVRGALAPGLRWHEAGNAEVMGREAVLQQMSRAVKRIDGYVAVHDVLANDEHVLALINVALRKPDGSESWKRAST